ncbi:E3 SUMO-protein ligase CBX4-like isoform X2 [Dunckerocampus dactyliophorus]|nr:E3 SUMO-protein ligase CBX4-like isoform X2 [Dunckerocampus dactyliophorus]
MGYRKRGPKPKHLLVQVPSFARRSSVLADLNESSLDEDRCPKTGCVPMLRPQSQKYQLNCNKHHQYQPLSQDDQTEQHTNGKNFYYQLNTKKLHHFQTGLKSHESAFAKPREVNTPQLSSKGYNLPPGLEQKWFQDKTSGVLTKVKDITMELKKLPADLNGHKEPEKAKQKDHNVSGRKLKIVKNKNKNGRIVIVMSKYMESGMRAAKVQNSESQSAEKQSQGPGSTETHLQKMKLVKQLGLIDGFAKKPKAVSDLGFTGECSKKEDHSTKTELSVTEKDNHVEIRGPVDQPLRLTTKPDPLSLPPDTGVTSFTDSKRTQDGFQGLKRHCSDTDSEGHGGNKRFLAFSHAVPSHTQMGSTNQNSHPGALALQRCEYAAQEQPIDLSIVKSKPAAFAASRPERHAQDATQADTQLKEQSESENITSADTVESSAVVDQVMRKADAFPALQPFRGNIIITDITTNCLTVTFKEYVTV